MSAPWSSVFNLGSARKGNKKQQSSSRRPSPTAAAQATAAEAASSNTAARSSSVRRQSPSPTAAATAAATLAATSSEQSSSRRPSRAAAVTAAAAEAASSDTATPSSRPSTAATLAAASAAAVSSSRRPSPLALLSETAASPADSVGERSSVVQAINDLVKDHVIQDTQPGNLQRDVVAETQDSFLEQTPGVFFRPSSRLSGHQSSYQPSSQLGLSEEEPAQPQQDAELALFNQAIDDFVDYNNIINGDDDNNNIIDDDDDNNNSQSASTYAPADWENASPDVVLAKLKQIKPEVFERFGLRPFYKSYIYWEKMTGEQRNKAVAWYRKLSPEIQGIAIITKV